MGNEGPESRDKRDPGPVGGPRTLVVGMGYPGKTKRRKGVGAMKTTPASIARITVTPPAPRGCRARPAPPSVRPVPFEPPPWTGRGR